MMEDNIRLQAELEELRRKLTEKPSEHNIRIEEINRSLDSLEGFMVEKCLDHKFLYRELDRLEGKLTEGRENLKDAISFCEGKERQIISLRQEIERELRISQDLLKRRIVAESTIASEERELEIQKENLKKLHTVDVDLVEMEQKLMGNFSEKNDGWDLLRENLGTARMTQEEVLSEIAFEIKTRVRIIEKKICDKSESFRVFTNRSEVLRERISKLSKKLSKEQREYQDRLAEQEEIKYSIDKGEKQIFAVHSFHVRIEKLNATHALIKKEHEEWLTLEKPIMEARVMEISSLLKTSAQEPPEISRPKPKEVGSQMDTPQETAQKPRPAVTELMPKIEERLEKEVREKFQDLDEQHRELEEKIRAEEENLKNELAEKLKVEEENKKGELNRKLEEEEKSLKEEMQKKLSEEEERLRAEMTEKIQCELTEKQKIEEQEESKKLDTGVESWQEKYNKIIRKKKEDFEKKLKVWVLGQKKSMESRLKIEEQNRKQELKEFIEKEKNRVLAQLKQTTAHIAKGKKEDGPASEQSKPAEVVELVRNGENQSTEEKEAPAEKQAGTSGIPSNNDSQGNPMVYLADSEGEVKIKGIIEPGILANLGLSSVDILFNKVTEDIRPEQIIPRVLINIPDGEMISGRAKVLSVGPNPYAQFPFKFLFRLELMDLLGDKVNAIKKYIERRSAKILKEENIQVNSL